MNHHSLLRRTGSVAKQRHGSQVCATAQRRAVTLGAVLMLLLAGIVSCAGGAGDSSSHGARDTSQPEPIPPSRTVIKPPSTPGQAPVGGQKSSATAGHALGEVYCFVGVGGSTDKIEQHRLPDVLVNGGWPAWSRDVAPQVDRFYAGYRGKRRQCIVHTPFGFTTGDMKFQMWSMARDNPRLVRVAGPGAYEPFKTAMSRLANLSTAPPWIYFGTPERDPMWSDPVHANLNPKIDAEVQWARAVTDYLAIDSSSDEDANSVCWYIAGRLQKSGATIGYEGWPARSTPWPAQAAMTCFVWSNQVDLIERQKPSWPALRDEVKGPVVVVEVAAPREDTVTRCARYLIDYGNVAFPPWHPAITAESIRARAVQMLAERAARSRRDQPHNQGVSAGAVGGDGSPPQNDADAIDESERDQAAKDGAPQGDDGQSAQADEGELLRRYADPGRAYPTPAVAPLGVLVERTARNRSELQALAGGSQQRIVLDSSINVAGGITIDGNDLEIVGRGGGKIVHAGAPGSGTPKDPRDVLITIAPGARRIVLRDLEIECNGHSAVRIMGRPQDILLDNLTIHRSWFGIDASQGRPTRLLARNVDFGRFGKYGYFGGGEHVILAGCTFRGSEYEHLIRLYDMQELLLYKCTLDFEMSREGLTKSAMWLACVSGASIIGCDSRNGRWIIGPNHALDDGCMTDSIRLLGNRIQLRPGQTFAPIQLNRGAGHVIIRDNTIVRVSGSSAPVVGQKSGHASKPPATFEETGSKIEVYEEP